MINVLILIMKTFSLPILEKYIKYMRVHKKVASYRNDGKNKVDVNCNEIKYITGT